MGDDQRQRRIVMKKKLVRELILLLVITLVVVTVGRVTIGLIRYTNYRYKYVNCYLLNEEFFSEYGKEYFIEACGLDKTDKW